METLSGRNLYSPSQWGQEYLNISESYQYLPSRYEQYQEWFWAIVLVQMLPQIIFYLFGRSIGQSYVSHSIFNMPTQIIIP